MVNSNQAGLEKYVSESHPRATRTSNLRDVISGRFLTLQRSRAVQLLQLKLVAQYKRHYHKVSLGK